MVEDKMVGWQKFEQTPGDSGGQRNWYAVVHEAAKNWTWLSDWTIIILE